MRDPFIMFMVSYEREHELSNDVYIYLKKT